VQLIFYGVDFALFALCNVFICSSCSLCILQLVFIYRVYCVYVCSYLAAFVQNKPHINHIINVKKLQFIHTVNGDRSKTVKIIKM